MALKILLQGSSFNAIGHDSVTGETGYLQRLKNTTGAVSVKGTLVTQSTTADDSLVLEVNEFDTFGIVAESGVADNEFVWVWKNGSRALVLFKDANSSTRGYVAIASDTAGRAVNVAVPSSTPAAAEHFKEIGHVLESKSDGTDVLVLVELHFN